MIETKLRDELNQINNDIIAQQKTYIKELEEHVKELHAIIKTHLIKDVEL